MEAAEELEGRLAKKWKWVSCVCDQRSEQGVTNGLTKE